MPSSDSIVHAGATTTLSAQLVQSLQMTHSLLASLPSERWLGPQMDIVNPPRWEVGHVGWFLEDFALRRGLGQPSARADAAYYWDSIRLDHGERWSTPMPAGDEAMAFLDQAHDRVQQALNGPAGRDRIFLNLVQLALWHQDMHNEAFAYTMQTLGDRAPDVIRSAWPGRTTAAPVLAADIEIAGGSYTIGSDHGPVFCFDNECDRHEVAVGAFAISSLPVGNAEFLRFVEEDGYRRRELWSEDGWTWNVDCGRRAPVHWSKDDAGRWWRRRFDEQLPLDPGQAVVHVNWYEAEAYCVFAGRRLPSEFEWEVAATAAADCVGDANLDWRLGDVVASTMEQATATTMSDSVANSHCRQMLGNVWEWTASAFQPYPGFRPGVYREYSQPWFGSRKVLRGGSWCTMARMVHARFRNFFEPHRSDIYAGFRTCRAEERRRP